MAAKTIMIKGNGIRNERYAAGAITPGMLVEIESTGDVQAHSTAGGSAQRAFAVEDDLQGKEIGDAYTTDGLVQYNVVRAGDQVNGLIANGEDIAIGDFLESNGDGYLRKVDADASVADIGVQSIVGVATEAVDMSSSSLADPSDRCIVDIL